MFTLTFLLHSSLGSEKFSYFLMIDGGVLKQVSIGLLKHIRWQTYPETTLSESSFLPEVLTSMDSARPLTSWHGERMNVMRWRPTACKWICRFLFLQHSWWLLAVRNIADLRPLGKRPDGWGPASIVSLHERTKWASDCLPRSSQTR